MRKSLFLAIAAGLLTMTACKKNEETKTIDQSIEMEDSARTAEMNTPAPAVNPQEEMIKEAKSKPLTTLALSEKHFDFKDVKKGESVEHKYEITNTGSNPLIISNVKPGCGCTAPDYSKEPILPGQKGFVTLKFDSSSFEGTQNKTAAVFANVEETPIQLSFTANVVN